MFDCEQLQTPLLDAQMALSKLRLCDLFWVAWTEFGSVGVGRRAILTQIDRKRQAPGHPGVDPVELYSALIFDDERWWSRKTTR